MRVATIVGHLRSVAEACAGVAGIGVTLWERERPLVLAAYVLGPVLDGGEAELTEVALVADVPSVDLPWGTMPTEGPWFESHYRIDRRPIRCYWRPRDRPVANHRIRRPARFWTPEGTDEPVLQALVEGRLDAIPRQPDPAPEALAQQLREEAAESLDALNRLLDAYWERDWRAEHRGLGRYPEHALWEAAWGHADIVGTLETG